MFFARFARFTKGLSQSEKRAKRGGATKIVSCRSTPQNKMAQERGNQSTNVQRKEIVENDLRGKDPQCLI